MSDQVSGDAGQTLAAAPGSATFTLEQIKAAFWKEFHKSGELWFNYFGSEEECNASTEPAWRDFEESLRAQLPNARLSISGDEPEYAPGDCSLSDGGAKCRG